MSYNTIHSVPNGTPERNMRIGYFCSMTKTGNSFTIAIPRDIRKALELEKGDYLWVEVKKVMKDEIES